jgi:GT2 family glycosyltransferase
VNAPTLESPLVSVCVSTRDRAERLGRLLQALEHQTLSPERFEVVVTDDGSRDETPQVLRAAAQRGTLRVKTLRHDTSAGPAAGRNAAWRAASAPVIAFIDDDCTPSAEWLTAGLSGLDSADVVVGAVTRHPDQAHRTSRFARELIVGREQVRWYATANIFYRRTDLEELGGFDESYPGAAGEDTDLGFRAEAHGLRTGFEPDAIVFHDVTAAGPRAAVKDQARWSALALVFASHPEQRARTLHHGVFWRPTHAEVLMLGAAVLLGTRLPAARALAGPWLHRKLCTERNDLPLATAVAELPGAFAVDVAGLAAVVRGSIRHRTLLL